MREIGKFDNSKIIKVSIIMLILVIPALALADFQPTFKPELQISKANGAIKIDGELDDAGWTNCATTGNFSETYPGDNTKPEVETKVKITYDDEYLYVAAICYDDPNDIRATMTQRDQFGNDDAFALMIDTYQNTVMAYKLYVNPYGIQKDFIYTNTMNDNIRYDLIWYSDAKITGEGFQVEMAIPFASIRFPNNDVQSWGIDFKRHRPRESSFQYEWSAKDREENCGLCQWGTMLGLGNVHPGKGIEILPSVISNQAGALTDYYDNNTFSNGDIMGQMSLGGKYSISSDVTVEAVYNPDFSQVEGDAAQIDVNSTVAQFYPERRPFFQEGIDIFRTLFNSFDTRTVNDPLLAVKLTGRTSKFRFGLLSAIDDNTQSIVPLEERSSAHLGMGKSYVNVFRGIYSLGSGSQIGYTINDKRYDIGGSNTVVGLDQDIRLSKVFSIDGQYLYTYTNEIDDESIYSNPEVINPDKETYDYGLNGESFGDFAVISRFKFSPRNFFAMFDYNQVGEYYQTQTGYDPWVNYRNMSIYAQYNIYPNSNIFETITPSIYFGRRTRMNWSPWFQNMNFQLETRFKYAQTNLNLSYSKNKERWGGRDFDGLWHYNIGLGGRFSNRLAYYASFNHGVGYAQNAGENGTENSYYLSLNLKPVDRLVIEPSLNWYTSHHRTLDKKFMQNYIIRNRVSLQLTKALSLRLVVQYYDVEYLDAYFDDNDNNELKEYYGYGRRWDIDPLITYRLNPFTIFYFGSTSDVSSAYTYETNPVSPEELAEGAFPYKSIERNRDMSSSSRQYFLKLQYLFQI